MKLSKRVKWYMAAAAHALKKKNKLGAEEALSVAYSIMIREKVEPIPMSYYDLVDRLRKLD